MKTDKITLCILVLCFSLFKVSAKDKDSDKKLEQADVLYKAGNFSYAIPLYLQLYQTDSSNSNLCYKIGVCYYNAGSEYKKAIYYLKRAVTSVSGGYREDSRDERNAPLKALRLLGDAYHRNYEFGLAISEYEKFKSKLLTSANPEGDLIRETERKMEVCRNAQELVSNPIDVKVFNLGKNINSTYADYSPRITADECTMIFTSRRPGNLGGLTYDGGQYYEDIYISTRKNKNSPWSPAKNIGWPINTVSNEAAIGISADGREILIYKDDMGDGNIYSSHLNGDKWTTPEKLNSNINSKYWEPAAFLSADGMALYFVSDRPGGYGGSDIYKSKRTASGDWGKAVNLGPSVNTEYDEYAPFIHPDGITLFFSSKGHKSMGGFDIFCTHALLSDEKAWVEPVNVGYPINTPGDDAFYTVTMDKQKAYYSSVRENGYGEKDNYILVFSDAKIAPISLLNGAVLDSNNKAPKNMVITVTDNETNEVIGIYYPNEKTGKYSFVLTPGKSNNISYEADDLLFYSEHKYLPEGSNYTESEKIVKLPDLAVGSKILLNNIFFDFDDSRLRPFSRSELNNVFNFLKKYPHVKIEISGYADSKGTDEYNRKLSAARAKAVMSYLLGRGIRKERIKVAGRGSANKKNEERTENDGERQLDRRVELKIISIK